MASAIQHTKNDLYSTQIDQNIKLELKEIFQDSWFGELNEKKAEELLRDEKKGTFLFRVDSSGEVFLSGVNNHSEIHHYKIRKQLSHWHGLNGGDTKSVTIHSLISVCLNIAETDCNLLKQQ